MAQSTYTRELTEQVRTQTSAEGNCVICGRKATDPYRLRNAKGEVMQGCIGVAHVGVVADEWMLRPEVQKWIADNVAEAEQWAAEFAAKTSEEEA